MEYIFEGFLRGTRVPPLELITLCHDEGGWRDKNLIIACAVSLSESAGFIRAHNKKWTRTALDEKGILVSMDIGLFQIKVDAEDIGSAFEKSLWNPIFNVHYARSMFDRRGWQPWYGYTNNIATNPAMRGKYIQRATWAEMNLRRKQFGMKPVPSPYVVLGEGRLINWVKQEV